ncbi:hypothetical protein TNCV_828241 [Trichonephila clavipes]|nr:hypothetical protein TNCV_828241 [Trichonephila clavipes]
MKRYDQKAYKLPPPTPAHVPAETNKRPLEQQLGPSSKRNTVFITPVIRPPVLIARPSTALATPQHVSIPDPPELTTSQIPDPPAPIPPELTTPQILLPDPSPAPIPPELTTPQILLPDPPVQMTPHILLPDAPLELTTPPQPPELMIPQIFLPDPPVQTTPQILLPDPPPVVETLEPTLMDASSMDQIMASVFGDYTPQGIPPAITEEPQVLDTVPSLFDESNDLISFLDHFETGLALEQQVAPMYLTMPRMKKKSEKKTTGFKVIEPLFLSVRNCLPCM